MSRVIALIILSCFLIQSVVAQTKPGAKSKKTDLLFSVGRTKITSEEFIYLYRKNHPDKPEEFTRARIDEYLKLFTDFKLKVSEAKARGLDTAAAFLKEYNTYRGELRKPYLPDNSLVDSLVKLTYERMKEEVRASHIMVAIKPEASPADTSDAYKRISDIRKQAISGADFGKLAAEVSQDPSAKVNGGDLGYFSAMQMVFPFENAAYSAEVGSITQPVRTRFGYHILKISDRRPSKGELEVSHIMIRLRDDKDQDRAKNTIFSVVEQLQAGVQWEELCNQYSEDPATKEQGGRLRPFGTGGMAAVPEFEKAAFDLAKPGDISDPVKTQYGWHLIRLEKKTPLASYDVVSTTLKGRVLRDERTTLSRQKAQTRLRERLSFKEDEAVKLKAFAMFDSTLLKGTWRKSSANTSAQEALFTLKNKPYRVQNFIDYVAVNQKVSAGPLNKNIDQLYAAYLENAVNEAAERDIIEHNPTYTFLLQEYYEGILLFEIMEKEVWSKASNDSVGQHKFYTDHIGQYQAGDRSKAVIYSASANSGFPELQSLIKAGDERRIQDYAINNKIKMEAGYFKKEEKDIFSKLPWTAGAYSVENKGMYYLAWLKEILPAGPMSFEEARPSVISDYQAHLEKVWLTQLKKKYPVKVNEKGKQFVIQNLQAK